MKRKILIIEDDEAIAEVERDYLEAGGFEADSCGDGTVGMSKALEGGYDLLILDVMLPGADGFTVCREVRKKSDIPILMVSARSEDIDKIRALGLGADDYVIKPFSPSELVARVKAHLARYDRLTGGESKAASSLVIGELEIQKDSRRVFVGGKEISLKNKEFELLNFLAENPNIVFSREKLFERVWGLDALGDDATVTVHINRLRLKLEGDATSPRFIETVWGAGYRLKK